jgi:diguanylate cyclase
VETEFALKNNFTGSDSKASEVVISWGNIIENLLKQLESNHGVLTTAKKRAALNHVIKKFSQYPEQLYIKLEALVNSWGDSLTSSQSLIDDQEISVYTPQNNLFVQNLQFVDGEERHGATCFIDQLLELHAQMLESIANSPLSKIDLIEEARTLAQQLRETHDDKWKVEQCISSFKQLDLKLESLGENGIKLQQGLLKLLNLLINSTGYLLSEDQWVKNRIVMLQEVISQPLDLENIERAEYYLKEIIQREKAIKQRMDEAKSIMKQMVTSLISSIEELSDSTGEFHDKLEYYSEKINQTDDVEAFNLFLLEIMHETKQMQSNTLTYRKDFLAARAEVSLAQDKINQLEIELLEMCEKVHEDHLTGILNRRGLDNAFEKEAFRALRSQCPLCFALLDIDNFKQLNDTHGHKVGDDALVYLVESIKNTTRPDDIVSRYGGEEFAILLPNTELEEAVHVLSRIRRNLTKRFFLHENNRLLITFSAGVAQFKLHETQENIFKRVDEALYRAKKDGKNRILTAE